MTEVVGIHKAKPFTIGMTYSFEYDAKGNIKNIIVWDGYKEVKYSFHWDAQGNLIGITKMKRYI